MLRPKDCPIPGCQSRGLIKLSNHLADVHWLSSKERKPWLQEAKLNKYSRTVAGSVEVNQLSAVMDLTFKHPTNVQIAGPTCCGKSFWTEQFLRHVQDLFDQPIHKIVYCYGEFQPQFLVMEQNIPNLQFIEGFPEDIYSLFDKTPGVLVIDDLMTESTNKDSMVNVITKGCHHRGISTLFLVQNLFPPGKHSRTISLNTHYFVAFKHPRDSLGVSILARQAFPKNTKYVMESFEDATKHPYGYLLFDLHPTTPDEGRLRTHIFPGEQQVAYVKRI